MEATEPQPARLRGAALAIMIVVTILSLLATLGLGLLAAMALFFTYDAPRTNSDMLTVQLIAISVPIFAFVTTVMSAIAVFTGERWAAWTGGVMFALMTVGALGFVAFLGAGY